MLPFRCLAGLPAPPSPSFVSEVHTGSFQSDASLSNLVPLLLSTPVERHVHIAGAQADPLEFSLEPLSPCARPLADCGHGGEQGSILVLRMEERITSPYDPAGGGSGFVASMPCAAPVLAVGGLGLGFVASADVHSSSPASEAQRQMGITQDTSSDTAPSTVYAQVAPESSTSSLSATTSFLPSYSPSQQHHSSKL